MQTECRRMQETDLDQVAEIERHSFSQPWSRDGFYSSMIRNDTIYMVAEQEGQLAGYCGLFQSFDEADITNVAVAEKVRGQGIGRCMLSALMDCGRKNGIRRFTLEVRKSNRGAIHLYEKLGFETAGIRKRFYQKPEEDAVIMWTKE